MTSQAHAEAVHRIYATFNEAIKQNDMSLLDTALTADVIDHNPDPDQKPGRDAIKAGFAGLAAAFPDFRFGIEDIIAEGDKVAVRMTCTGTHLGAFMGFAPTGGKVAQPLIDYLRLENGQIAERWGIADTFGLLMQLGLRLRGMG